MVEDKTAKDTTDKDSDVQPAKPGNSPQGEWGKLPEDNFGYASDEERRAKRGLEDWELVEHIPDSQQSVPRWFWGIVVIVLLIAIGLSFPFWGDRPGYERDWINWGFGAALLYIVVFGAFVYFMVNFYGSKMAGRLDSDKQAQGPEQATGKDKTSGSDKARQKDNT